MTSAAIELFGHTMRLTADTDSLKESRWLDEPIYSTTTSGDAVVESHLLEEASRQLEEFVAGSRHTFDLPLRPEGTDFRMKVWDELRRIPYGETITYAELARRIGHPKACRAVANACGANPLPVFIPCHRVVASGGKRGGYTGGLDIKDTLLQIEEQNCR